MHYTGLLLWSSPPLDFHCLKHSQIFNGKKIESINVLLKSNADIYVDFVTVLGPTI